MPLFNIFYTILLPIFVLMGIGFALDKVFRLDIQTLTRLGFYVFSPAVVFLMLVDSELQAGDLLWITGYTAAHAAVMAALSLALFSARPFAAKRAVLVYGSIFYNAGNYGFPLMLLAFGQEAVGVIAIVLVVQIAVMFTVGLPFFTGERELGRSLLRLAKTPVVYAVLLGLVLRGLDLDLSGPLAMPINRLGDAFIAMALLTLGAQLARSRFSGDGLSLVAGVAVRLVASPLVAVALVALLGLPADMRPVLIVGAGLPVAVNVSILATEFDRAPEFTSQIVFWTTLLSAVTIPALLALAG